MVDFAPFFFFFFNLAAALRMHSPRVGGDGLSLSIFLLDGPYKDEAVNHVQAS